MKQMSMRMAELLITERKWQPYIKGHWMDLGRGRGGCTITFKGHEAHVFKCSQGTGKYLLKLAKEKKNGDSKLRRTEQDNR